MVRANLVLKGRVQGVFFRANTKKKADKLMLHGYVRNLADGDVEVVVQGPKDKVDELIDYCINGTENGYVEDVDIEYSDEEDKEIEKFIIKY